MRAKPRRIVLELPPDLLDRIPFLLELTEKERNELFSAALRLYDAAVCLEKLEGGYLIAKGRGGVQERMNL